MRVTVLPPMPLLAAHVAGWGDSGVLAEGQRLAVQCVVVNVGRLPVSFLRATVVPTPPRAVAVREVRDSLPPTLTLTLTLTLPVSNLRATVVPTPARAVAVREVPVPSTDRTPLPLGPFHGSNPPTSGSLTRSHPPTSGSLTRSHPPTSGSPFHGSNPLTSGSTLPVTSTRAAKRRCALQRDDDIYVVKPHLSVNTTRCGAAAGCVCRATGCSGPRAKAGRRRRRRR
jgi:hypothetical protein